MLTTQERIQIAQWHLAVRQGLARYRQLQTQDSSIGRSDSIRPNPQDAKERVRLAAARCELYGPRLWSVMRYGGHDVSNEPRDEDGRWTEIGGGNATKAERPIASRPSASCAITDSNGNHVGHFNLQSGWVTRSVLIGDGRIEQAVASIDDVIRILNSAGCPTSAIDWNDWFIRDGRARNGADPTAPGYVPLQVQNDLDALVPQGKLTAISGFDSDGRPREYAASIAGPLVTRLIVEVCKGLLEKYAGGKVLGLTVNAAGKQVVRITRRGKLFVEELNDRMATRLRRRIDDTGIKGGTAEARQLKKWLDNNAPKPGWKSSLRWTTNANAELLRRNLGNSIKPGEHAHHIVQSTMKQAEPSRKLLDKYQIDINDAVNGVPLKGSGEKPAHHGHGLHSHAAIIRVQKRLEAAVVDAKDWATGRAELLNELDKLKKEILRGEFP